MTANPRWTTQRPPVIGGRAMISSGHPLATEAGLRTLRNGGNAFDAVITAAAVIAVVEPGTNHVGGDVFALCLPAGADDPVAINASGPSPAGLTLADFGDEIPPIGLNAATVPGAVKAWETILDHYGSMSLADALGPAIEYAHGGVPVDPDTAQAIANAGPALAQFAASARSFLPNGAPPRPGSLLYQSDLADTLRQIAYGGADAFYKGPFAEALVRASSRDGGAFTPRDLAAYSCEILPPLRAYYRGLEILEQPLPSQGFLLLEQLNIAEGFELSTLEFGSADVLHLMAECKKAAFADRLAHVGDPDWSDIPINRLLGKEFAAQRRMSIDPVRAAQHVSAGDPSAVGGDTTAVSAVDEVGNAITFIQSVFTSFGSCYVVPGTGVLLNNRMRGFSLDPASPNVFHGGKRPIHTLNTFMVKREDQLLLLGSAPGGQYQVQTNFQVISNVFDHGMHWQAAIDAPRWYHDEDTGDLMLEDRFDPAVITDLENRGHAVRREAPFSVYSRAQGVMLDPDTGARIGATDPRWHGQVLGF
ncbi:MAG: gamma-glutamyltransferase [Chloroflexi bacterium]|nr:gamma-glutamyltransferase [Chloroflexota bacterium]